MKFSLLLASRKRTYLLNNLLNSLEKTTKNLSEIEVLIGIDHDDLETQNFINPRARFFSRDRSEWLHRDYINWMFPSSSGKYIIVLNDDTEFVNQNWDELAWEKLEDYLKDKPDGVVFGWTSDNTGNSRVSCFPLISRAAANALGWVLPNEVKSWGADNDVVKIYTDKRIARKLLLPEIKINHITHHNNTRERDEISHHVESVCGGLPVDHIAYIDKLYEFILNNKIKINNRKLLVVYNICGIKRKDNSSYYIPAIHSILAQQFPDFQVCISGCMSSDIVKEKLIKTFGSEVSYNWIDEIHPLGVTFNKTVQKCFENQLFDAIVYVDSGVHFGDDYDILQKLWSRYEQGFGMVSALVDNDSGIHAWRLDVIPGQDYVMPLGKACNLHCQLFDSELYFAYSHKILPDIFASDTSESIFTFMCSGINKKWCLAHDVYVSHKIGVDGASSGFRNKQPFLYKTNRNINQICAEGAKIGFGYEEIRPVLIHDPSWYVNDNHRNPSKLRDFIKNNCFFVDEPFYPNLRSQFISYKNIKTDLPSPTMSCILVSHEKPEYVWDAINSVLQQSWYDWELLIIDSGKLYDQGFFDIDDRRVKVIRSDETAQIRMKKAMAPWCFNKMLRRINGYLVMYLCDDDILYSNAFETFVEFSKANPHVLAMYASQDMVSIIDGESIMTGERRAVERRGACVNGPNLDCQVDYLQFCHRADLLSLLQPEYWCENKNKETHADGVFMERIGCITPIYPIDIKVSQNRRTPISTYQKS